MIIYGVFGWQEIGARKVLKRERGRRCPTSPVGKTGEIGERDQFGVGPTLYLFFFAANCEERQEKWEFSLFSLFCLYFLDQQR